MRGNPVYKKEAMVSARSFRLTLVMLIFNGILASMALLNMYSTLEQVKRTAQVQYSSFLDLYIFVAILQFVMVILIMPALTAGSISSEREQRTLEVMLTTKLTPAQIVIGKLMSSLSIMGLMVMSSLPILALVFVYGGVTLLDIVLLLVSDMAAAVFIGALGICSSAFCQKSTTATIISYVAVALVVIGTYGINWFPAYLLLANPTMSFLMVMKRMAGGEPGWLRLNLWFSINYMEIQRFSHIVWIGASILLQLLIAGILIRIAILVLAPGKKGGGKNGVDRI